MFLDLTLRNFKIWKSTKLVRLAPVTFLLGTNSSGKSSLIQSLLLIRQTVRKDDPNVALDFGTEGTNDSVALGQFSDVRCRTASENTIGIEFTWTPTGQVHDAMKFDAVYKSTPTDAAEIASLRIGREQQSFYVKRQVGGAYRLFIGETKTSFGNSRQFRPQGSFTFSAAMLARLPQEQSRIVRDAGSKLLEELAKIIYLGPVRQLAKRHYQWNGIPPATIGDDGSRAVDALIASGIATDKSGDGGELLKKTGEWLARMGLADSLAVRRLGKSPLYELRVLKDGSGSNIRDVGVGVSQVLPVIVAALHAQPGHIVLVEEPESHLHPLAQATLAELFVQVGKERGIQIIAETHSEHLFRRVQTLLAKQEIKPEECALYFVEKNENEASLRELKTDEMGRISNWPEKFFGDSLGETKTQTWIMLQRLKEAKQSHERPTD